MSTIYECLRGAGCPHELCEGAERAVAQGRQQELLPALAERRMRLLGELHHTDAQLACLDRAIAQIRRGG